MSITELLSSQRRWGRTRTRKFLAPLGMTENKRLGTLTERQRQLLAAALHAKTGCALPGDDTEEHAQLTGAAIAA